MSRGKFKARLSELRRFEKVAEPVTCRFRVCRLPAIIVWRTRDDAREACIMRSAREGNAIRKCEESGEKRIERSRDMSRRNSWRRCFEGCSDGCLGWTNEGGVLGVFYRTLGRRSTDAN